MFLYIVHVDAHNVVHVDVPAPWNIGFGLAHGHTVFEDMFSLRNIMPGDFVPIWNPVQGRDIAVADLQGFARGDFPQDDRNIILWI